MLNSVNIYQNIKKNVFRTENLKETFQHSKRKFVSPVWNNFLAIFNDKNEPILTHVVCKFCENVFKHKLETCEIKTSNKEPGTTNLLRHTTKCRLKWNKMKPTKKSGK